MGAGVAAGCAVGVGTGVVVGLGVAVASGVGSAVGSGAGFEGPPPSAVETVVNQAPSGEDATGEAELPATLTLTDSQFVVRPVAALRSGTAMLIDAPGVRSAASGVAMSRTGDGSPESPADAVTVTSEPNASVS